MNLQTRKRLTDLEDELMVAWRSGQRDSWGVWDGHVHSVLFYMDNHRGPTAQHMELCSMLCGSLDGRGVWRRMDPCVPIADSFTVHMKLSQGF